MIMSFVQSPKHKGSEIMTNKDYIEKYYPQQLSETAVGGVMGCPEDYGLTNSLRDSYYCKNDCTICWSMNL